MSKIEHRNCNKSSELVATLQIYFGGKMHLARIKFLAQILCAICRVQTVCFERLASAFDNEAKRESSLRRIQRFIANYQLCPQMIARFIVALLPHKPPFALSMDRTNWQYGSIDINILVLAITYKGIAFPVLFKMLPKRGNSNTSERIELVDTFIKLFGIEGIDTLTADREFVGQQWFSYLNSHRIRYYIRIKDNYYITDPRSGKRIKASWLFNGVPLGRFRSHSRVCLIGREYCYLAASKIKNRDGKPELQIIASFNKPELSRVIYKERWQIESAFKSLKTSGFNVEDTHLRDIDRLERLFAIVIMAFTWAYITGVIVHQSIKPIRICKHGYPAKSFVKYGLEWIYKWLMTTQKVRSKISVRRILSCS